MTTTITIKRFDYLFLKNDYFNKSKDSRLRNDIIYVEYKDGTKEARIYLNNKPEYIVIPYNNIMLSEISKITWTKDSEHYNGTFVKSESDKTNLIDYLIKFGYDKKYGVYDLDAEEEELKQLKEEKRKKFIKENSLANTDYPDDAMF